MPVKADYKRAKKVSVLEGLEEMRAEAAKKAAAEAALPKFKKFDPQYAEASLVPELRATRPPKEGGGDEAPAWMSQALNAKRKRRRRGSKACGPDALPDHAGAAAGRRRRGRGRRRRVVGQQGVRRRPARARLAAGLRPVEPSAHLELAERKAAGNKDWGPSVFERDSPRARATLRTSSATSSSTTPGATCACARTSTSGPTQRAIGEVRTATVQEICVMQPAMTSLDVTDCHLVTDAALWACDHITDDGLAVLASGCRDLEHVDVSGCPRLGEFGDRALLALGRFCGRLERLDMFGCAHVQDAGIIAVARGCGGLEKLRLTGCRELTGGALAALARQCPNLVDLSIAGCERIKDEDLCKLVGQSGAVDLQRSGGPHWQGGRAAAFGAASATPSETSRGTTASRGA
ncbi:hypothetical protein SO694_00098074 [Aureococcus anophagefferens]|uniref:F-box/LRR-repeat protein 15-like leucin rich repeat domain-containing protein n=1 Tax=Aureococcus anophagefferens TaxID=44056 RepID=A0ABR1FST1_AURAN